MGNIKSVKEYLLNSMQIEQKKPNTPLKGDKLSRRDEALLLVAGAALSAMERDYLQQLSQLLEVAQKDRAELVQLKMILDRLN